MKYWHFFDVRIHFFPLFFRVSINQSALCVRAIFYPVSHRSTSWSGAARGSLWHNLSVCSQSVCLRRRRMMICVHCTLQLKQCRSLSEVHPKGKDSNNSLVSERIPVVQVKVRMSTSSTVYIQIFIRVALKGEETRSEDIKVCAKAGVWRELCEVDELLQVQPLESRLVKAEDDTSENEKRSVGRWSRSLAHLYKATALLEASSSILLRLQPRVVTLHDG